MVDDKGGTNSRIFLKIIFIQSEYLVPYWKLPKRAPIPLEFDINNNL
jgi:hypothetical protein